MCVQQQRGCGRPWAWHCGGPGLLARACTPRCQIKCMMVAVWVGFGGEGQIHGGGGGSGICASPSPSPRTHPPTLPSTHHVHRLGVPQEGAKVAPCRRAAAHADLRAAQGAAHTASSRSSSSSSTSTQRARVRPSWQGDQAPPDLSTAAASTVKMHQAQAVCGGNQAPSVAAAGQGSLGGGGRQAWPVDGAMHAGIGTGAMVRLVFLPAAAAGC